MAKANKLIPVVNGTAGTPIELTDSRIEITNPAANDLLQYDSTQQQFVNTPVNSKVKQTVDATTTEYPLLVSAQSSPTSGTAYEAKYSASLKATGEGDVVFVKNSKKCKLQYNSTDLCLNFVFE